MDLSRDVQQRDEKPETVPTISFATQFLSQHLNVTREKSDLEPTFQKLCDDILSGSAIDYSDLEGNAKLLHVVTEAGLDTLVRLNPLQVNHDVLLQAQQSIAVLRVTLERAPQILLHPFSARAQNTETPLFLWLFSRIVTFLGSPNFHSLQEHLVEVLVTYVRCTYTLRRLSKQRHVFARLFLGSANTVLTALNAAQTGSVEIPSPRRLAALLSSTNGSLTLINGCTTILSGEKSLTDAAVCLLEAVAAITSLETSRQYGSPWTATLIDELCTNTWKLWDDIASRNTQTHFRSVDATYAARLLHTLEKAWKASAKSSATPAGQQGAISILIDMCTEMLRGIDFRGDTLPVQLILASAVTNLAAATRKWPWVQTNAGDLNSTASALLKSDSNMELLSIELRKSLVLLNKASETASDQISKDAPEAPRREIHLRNDIDDIDMGDNSESNHVAVQKNVPFRPLATSTAELDTLGSPMLKATIDWFRRAGLVAAGRQLSLSVERFVSLSEAQKRETIRLLATMPCALLNEGPPDREEDPDEYLPGCPRCSSKTGTREKLDKIPDISNERPLEECVKFALQSLHDILQILSGPRTAHMRIAAMSGIASVLCHTENEKHLRLDTSPFGEFCLRSLHSSAREMRLVAASMIKVFLRHEVAPGLKDDNSRAAMKYLRTLSERFGPNTAEAIIHAWTSIGLSSNEEHLNMVLIHLVEYLGHISPILSGMAFTELLQLASDLELGTEELFRPYWASVGPFILKDFFSRPQKAHQLGDVLQININQLLLTMEAATLPFLVSSRRTDLLKRLASAHGTDTSVQYLITRRRTTLAAVISAVLIQSDLDIERDAAAFFREVLPDVTDEGLSSLFSLEPVLIVSEMLKASGEKSAEEKAIIRQRILSFVTIFDQNKTKSAAKRARILTSFFDKHILGIVAHLSDIIGGTGYSVGEKKRSLKAFVEICAVAPSALPTALPQMRACLQQALTSEETREEAISTVSSIILSIDENSIRSLLDPSLAILVFEWDVLTSESQQKIYDLLDNIFSNHSQILHDSIYTLPSLSGIPLLAKFSTEIERLKAVTDVTIRFHALSRRCLDENTLIAQQALQELLMILREASEAADAVLVVESSSAVIAELMRSLLDAAVRFNRSGDQPISDLCGQCLGAMGCYDPNGVELVRGKLGPLVLSNFERIEEVMSFATVALEHVLVPAFNNAPTARAQGFLGYVMQELMVCCGMHNLLDSSERSNIPPGAFTQWLKISDSARITLTPFLSSRYVLQTNTSETKAVTFPIIQSNLSYSSWLRAFAYELSNNAVGENARPIANIFSRVIRSQDLSIAQFLLPYLTLNVIIGGTAKQIQNIEVELDTVFQSDSRSASHHDSRTILQCSESLFQVLDYLARWLQERRKSLSSARQAAARSVQPLSKLEESKYTSQITSVESILSKLPAKIIAPRAIECGSYTRALYHWELHMRKEASILPVADKEIGAPQYKVLQEIYSHIDEPDGLDGISAHLHILDPAQQVLQHERAGRWKTAQTWYELQLEDKPDDDISRVKLVECLEKSAQYELLLDFVERSCKDNKQLSKTLLPHAVRASILTEQWEDLERLTSEASVSTPPAFDFTLAQFLLDLRAGKAPDDSKIRVATLQSLSASNTSSLQACHEQLFQLQMVEELRIMTTRQTTSEEDPNFWNRLDRGLDVLGSYNDEKQQLLSIRRAVMAALPEQYTKLDIAASWLSTAKLARKSDQVETAFKSLVYAMRLGEGVANIEHSKLLWKEGQHRKAIQNLESAITENAFQSYDSATAHEGSMSEDRNQMQNLQTARANLLLAKWLDAGGQTSSSEITLKYQQAVKFYSRWEKGHYYLGRHYDKLLEAEKLLPTAKQSASYRCGETAKLVVQNYLRAMAFGHKYLYQTLPRLLTLWLDVGSDAHASSSARDPDFHDQRNKILDAIHRQLKKYADMLPAWEFYTALPQMITRISHPHAKVWDMLASLIIKVVSVHSQQALWGIFAVSKSSSAERSHRGTYLINKLREQPRRGKVNNQATDMKTLVTQGQRLTDSLLQACEARVDRPRVSLSKDLGFSHRLAPCHLVVPVEKSMAVSLPTTYGAEVVRSHKAFARDPITIHAFEDDVLVLNSLQKPRKLTVRGTDGELYGLLCKPKDDLRKDQRLMEFNTTINRALKHDPQASKRRLGITTYAVTPLNEECGTIEWVEGLKPMRDIVSQSYRSKGVRVDYNEIKQMLNDAISDDSGENLYRFEQILQHFFPVLHEWFTETFPQPDSWFAARLRYTRSCAVMSMVGHVLGLGDRHGENILLQEGNGAVFHVDFNCLFDKGLTFEKPEVVPFRLTHNMVDAMGAYGTEGPFRASSEVTLSILRQQQNTLMTILETFLYDPTQDFIGKKKRSIAGVPETPQEVLDSIRGKLRGLLRGESVPLSVEGQVETLIKQATTQWNLARMYIGWCAFW